MNFSAAKKIATTIMDFVLQFRLVTSPECTEFSCPDCMAHHLPKITRAVIQGEPVQFVIAGFPFKAPSPTKTLGSLPDMAEIVALRHLESLCVGIRCLYSPGAQLVIGSDGRLFNDLLEVSEKTVRRYTCTLQQVIRENSLQSLQIYTLDNLLSARAGGDIRDYLPQESLESLHSEVRQSPLFLRQINGTERFLKEDLRAVHPGISQTKLQRLARETAYLVAQRSRGFSTLLRERFPNAVRLSIHAHHPHGEKFGIFLNSPKDCGTPWHTVAVFMEDSALLPKGSCLFMRRDKAEQMGAALVLASDGRPSHYVISQPVR